MRYVSVRSIVLPLVKKKVAAVDGLNHLPNRGPYLIAANHVDYLDGFFISSVVYEATRQPVHFLTKTNNYWWTRVTIPIDEKRRSSSVDDAFMYLKRGKIICNFIEGSRNPLKYLLRGKTGTARLALLADVPVIPIGIQGGSSRNFLKAMTNIFTDRGEVRISIGQPVDVSDLKGRLDGSAVHEATHRIMAALVPLTGKAYIR